MPGVELRGDGHPPQVLAALGGCLGAGGPVDHVVHSRRHQQSARVGAVRQDHPETAVREELRSQSFTDTGADARVSLGGGRQGLVGHQLRLSHEPCRAVQGLDLVQDRGDRSVRERHQPDGGDPHPLPGGREPLDLSPQNPGAEVEHPPVLAQIAIADIERLVVDEQADDLAVGDVDHRLPCLGIPVAPLGVRQRPGLVEAVQVRARQAVRLALIEVRPKPDVPVGEGEDRLAVREH